MRTNLCSGNEHGVGVGLGGIEDSGGCADDGACVGALAGGVVPLAPVGSCTAGAVDGDDVALVPTVAPAAALVVAVQPATSAVPAAVRTTAAARRRVRMVMLPPGRIGRVVGIRHGPACGVTHKNAWRRERLGSACNDLASGSFVTLIDLGNK
jgi:hypothetical protein